MHRTPHRGALRALLGPRRAMHRTSPPIRRSFAGSWRFPVHTPCTARRTEVRSARSSDRDAPCTAPHPRSDAVSRAAGGSQCTRHAPHAAPRYAPRAPRPATRPAPHLAPDPTQFRGLRARSAPGATRWGESWRVRWTHQERGRACVPWGVVAAGVRTHSSPRRGQSPFVINPCGQDPNPKPQPTSASKQSRRGDTRASPWGL